MAQANVDMLFLQDMKLIGGVYMWGSAVYCIITTNAYIWHQVGEVVFDQDSPRFSLGAYQQHVPNVVSFQMV